MLTADTITDDVIRRVRQEARDTKYGDLARCCSAALGLDVGDGALGLLDKATCRGRIAAIVNNNLSCGLDTYGVSANDTAITGDNVTDEQIRELRERMIDRVVRGVDTITDREAIEICDDALDGMQSDSTHTWARMRCAQRINTEQR